MMKRTFASQLTVESPPAPPDSVKIAIHPVPVNVNATQIEAAPKAVDDRTVTTVRISREGLEALKIVAALRRTKVNDLVLEGIEHILALNDRKIRLRR